ncbi:hypothetical protein GCM10027614_81700 [Micromonospora vulcania]
MRTGRRHGRGTEHRPHAREHHRQPHPEYWDALVKPFEEQSGLDVKIEAPTGKDVASTFPTLLAAGTAPDVVQSITPQTDTAPELVDLSGEDWAKDTPLVDKYAIDGKRLVAGAGMQAQSLVFYNKKAFQAAGITETPKYWDQFEVSLGKLKTAGYIPLQTGGQWLTGLQVQQLWHPTLNTQHPDWVQSLAKGDLALGDAYEPILKRYADWIHAGYINKSDVGLDSSGADANFIAGKVGFYTGGSWFASSLKKTGNLPFEVGLLAAGGERAGLSRSAGCHARRAVQHLEGGQEPRRGKGPRQVPRHGQEGHPDAAGCRRDLPRRLHDLGHRCRCGYPGDRRRGPGARTARQQRCADAGHRVQPGVHDGRPEGLQRYELGRRREIAQPVVQGQPQVIR